ncbi:MAG: 16S rRNA (uracil(1498)-N(3))-methyltransferase [Ekhidna sp.]|nr:16S rRNA (uracil(1498)-N(3))-methyltransferase [Ekhidna sp.]
MSVFYQKNISKGDHFLSEEESKHCVQVLRRQKGDEIVIFDGLGSQFTAQLTEVNKKKCTFDILSEERKSPREYKIHLAIAPTKNMDRMEWMVEKLVEIGVDKITLIQTDHSERRKIRLDRLEKKAISAMKQSKNAFLPELSELTPFNDLMKNVSHQTRLIAHVDQKNTYITTEIQPKTDTIILIGPEGDFSKEEITLALDSGFRPVSLGENTLRTETAGLVACCLLNSYNFL